MIPARNICSLCIRTDVKFYHLDDSIRAPNDLRFEGHKNLQAVLENILNKKRKDEKTANEICQKCRHKLHEIYSFTNQHTESEKIFRKIRDVTVRLKKLKTVPMLSDFKTEFEAISDTDKEMDSQGCGSTIYDKSAVSGVVVKMECDNNFEGTDFNIVTKDINVVVMEGKYSNATDGKSFEEMEIDSIGNEVSEQIIIEDEIIKEEWTIHEDDIFEAKHNVLDKDQTKFSCDRCDEEFATASCLKEHSKNVHGFNRAIAEQKTETEFKSQKMRSIEGQNPKFTNTVSNICESGKLSFNCDQCEAKFKTSRSLKDHKMSHTDVTFACNQCDANFSNKRGLKEHLRAVHTDAVFSCDQCDSTYKNKKNLNAHKEIHSGILFNCDQCDAKFKTSRSLKDHKMSHTGVTFTCNQCNASFSNRNSLTTHLRGVHTDTVFACDHCNATYKRKQTLKEHKQMHKGILFNCDQCDAKYKTRAGLSDHKMTHTGVTFTCNQCDASFSNKRGLTHHLRAVHTDAVFSCDHCDATYKSKQALNQHKLTINGIIFNCDQCDARFKSSGGLSDHKMSHTGVTFPCNQCDASFSSKRSIRQHLRGVHTDAVFSCDQCDSTYKNKKKLNVHKEIHSGILFNCDQCDAKFKTSRSLKDHKMSHTGVTSTCNQCDASFSNRKSLTKHLRGVHTDAVLTKPKKT